MMGRKGTSGTCRFEIQIHFSNLVIDFWVIFSATSVTSCSATEVERHPSSGVWAVFLVKSCWCLIEKCWIKMNDSYSGGVIVSIAWQRNLKEQFHQAETTPQKKRNETTTITYIYSMYINIYSMYIHIYIHIFFLYTYYLPFNKRCPSWTSKYLTREMLFPSPQDAIVAWPLDVLRGQFLQNDLNTKRGKT